MDATTMRADVMRALKDVSPEIRNHVAEIIDRHAGSRPNTPPAPTVVRPNAPPPAPPVVRPGDGRRTEG